MKSKIIQLQCKENYVRYKRDLHVFRMMTDAVDQLVWLQLTNANPMDACEQRKPKRKKKKEETFY